MIVANSYRADIDGLRAVAVLSVIWYHSGLPGLPGGFAGVDIFFVISGYLIAQIISRDLDSGRFSLSGFYQRRVRRIAPALLSTLIVTLVAGYVLLVPGGLVELGRSSLASLAMVPNLYFWLDAPEGYFAAIKRLPPLLLHMWSLGIEEQFYLFFPLFLLVVHRFGLVRAAILAVVIVSFLLNALIAYRSPNAAFYLLPTRAWELAAGALLSAGMVQIPPRWRSATSVIGLALIVASFVLLDETAPFAAVLLAVPVIGAALLIGSGISTPANRLIGLPPLVWIGRISYSLYVLHWPILVYLLMLQPTERLPPAVALAALASAIMLAAISYYLVEQPARRSSVRFRTVAIGSIAGALLVIGLSLVPLLTAGLPQRLSSQALAIAAQSEDHPPLARRCLEVPLDRIETKCMVGNTPPTALIWGDSHASANSSGIAAGLNQPSVLAAMGGCAPLLDAVAGGKPDRCIQRNRDVLAWVKARPEIQTVVLSANWPSHARMGPEKLWQGIDETIAALPGRRVIIIAGTPNPKVDVPVVSAMRQQLGLSPLRWTCPSANVSAKGATIIDLSAAYCAHPQAWMLFTDSNHASQTANREVIAPALRATLSDRTFGQQAGDQK